jgi:hypothetical protein
MSIITPLEIVYSADEPIVPVMESQLFAEHQDRKFAVGAVAYGGVALPGMDSEYEGTFELRRRVYVDEMKFLNNEELDENGVERDIDDDRSVAFGVFENRGNGRVASIAFTRLIGKAIHQELDMHDDRPLPIEKYYASEFQEKPAPQGSVEVSRLISRHESAPVQDMATWLLYGATLAHIKRNNLGPTFGIVETWLERRLGGLGVAKRIGDPVYVERYKTENVPILIDTERFVVVANKRQPGIVDACEEMPDSMIFVGSTDTASAVNSKEVS